MKTCLVVDDSKVVRMVARKILEGLEFEVDEAEDGKAALAKCVAHMPDAVLLDNMGPEELRKAVAIVAGRAATEASGRITPENAAAIGGSGVDYISSGWITHSAPALDLGLDIEISAPRRAAKTRQAGKKKK